MLEGRGPCHHPVHTAEAARGEEVAGPVEIGRPDQKVEAVHVAERRIRIHRLGEGGAAENDRRHILRGQDGQRLAEDLAVAASAQLLVHARRAQVRQERGLDLGAGGLESVEQKRHEALEAAALDGEGALRIRRPRSPGRPRGAGGLATEQAGAQQQRLIGKRQERGGERGYRGPAIPGSPHAGGAPGASRAETPPPVDARLQQTRVLVVARRRVQAAQVVPVQAPVQEHVGQDLPHGAMVDRAEKPVGVVAVKQGRIEPADAIEERPAGHQGPRHVAGERARPRIVARRAGLAVRLRRPEVLSVRQTEVELGTHLEATDLARQLVRMPDVVRIEECDELSPREAEARVARGRGARVRLMDVGDIAAVRLRDPCRPVDRPVVDDDHLEGPKRLAADAVERLAEEALAVEHRHDAAHRETGASRPGRVREHAPHGSGGGAHVGPEVERVGRHALDQLDEAIEPAAAGLGRDVQRGDGQAPQGLRPRRRAEPRRPVARDAREDERPDGGAAREPLGSEQRRAAARACLQAHRARRRTGPGRAAARGGPCPRGRC